MFLVGTPIALQYAPVIHPTSLLCLPQVTSIPNPVTITFMLSFLDDFIIPICIFKEYFFCFLIVLIL